MSDLILLLMLVSLLLLFVRMTKMKLSIDVLNQSFQAYKANTEATLADLHYRLSRLSTGIPTAPPVVRTDLGPVATPKTDLALPVDPAFARPPPSPLVPTPQTAVFESPRPTPPAPALARSILPQIEPPPVPAPLAHAPMPPSTAAANTPAPAALSLEQFVGVKLAAWLGGLALFMGVIFFVKYSLDHGWISPSARTALGFITGGALIGGGLRLHRNATYTVLAQTLCATGVVVLYGVTFAGFALYALYGQVVAFALMASITAAAFTMSVRLNAQVIAVLGMLGGFLTPLFCSTGHDNPAGLFGYIALLDLGLLMVVRRTGWTYLAGMAAAGTILMQWGWMLKFYAPTYQTGSARLVPMAVLLGFAAVFTTAVWRGKTPGRSGLGAAIALGISAFVFGFVGLTDHGSYNNSPGLLYGYVFAAAAILLSLTWCRPTCRPLHHLLMLGTALHLAIWTCDHQTSDWLHWALGLFLIYGLAQTVEALMWAKRHPGQGSRRAIGWSPLLSLLLMLLPVGTLPSISFAIWPALLLANLAVIGLAVFTRNVWPVIIALIITLVATVLWLHGSTRDLALLRPFLGLVAGFSAVFTLAGGFLLQRLRPQTQVGDTDHALVLLPVAALALPFGLLFLAILTFPMTSPTLVFGVGMALAVLQLLFAYRLKLMALLPITLGCVIALQYCWAAAMSGSLPQWARETLPWYLGFYALFAGYPVLFRRAFSSERWPWITAALIGVGELPLLVSLIERTWPTFSLGLLSAILAIAPLALLSIVRSHSQTNPAKMSQLAWLGGAALFFITLIFPLEFSRQWLTVAWALEGAALCWFFHRVPHPGLRATGFVLLCLVFIRLVPNPMVYSEYHRSGTAIFNWYLYAYSLAALSSFAAARWLSPPRERVFGLNASAILWALGGVLCFALLNIEIADYFSPPTATHLHFDFAGNLARDMTYSIAWALFALGLVVLGIVQRQSRVRFAGLGLLGITLLKLFLHDLASLDSIYRVAALMVVAIIALGASFLYQRFLTRIE
jgi:uncharacterized membrane protein